MNADRYQFEVFPYKAKGFYFTQLKNHLKLLGGII